jgi:hypothetical protein
MSKRALSLAFVLLAPTFVACWPDACCPVKPVYEVVAIQDGSALDARSIVSPAVLALGIALAGTDLSMSVQDTEGDDARAVEIAGSLADDERVVAVVVAPFTRLPAEGRDELLRSNVPVVSLSQLVAPPDREGAAFRSLVGSVRREAQALVGLAGAHRVCLATEGNGSSAVLSGAVRRAVAEPLRRVTLGATEGCGSLIWTGSGPAVGAVVGTLGATTLVVGDAARTDSVVRRPGGVHGRILAACPCADVSTSTRPEAQRFLHDYQEATGLDAGPYAVEGSDAGGILLSALEQDPSRDAAAAAVEGLDAFHGLGADYRWIDGSLDQPGVRLYRAVGVRWLSADASS